MTVYRINPQDLEITESEKAKETLENFIPKVLVAIAVIAFLGLILVGLPAFERAHQKSLSAFYLME